MYVRTYIYIYNYMLSFININIIHSNTKTSFIHKNYTA